LSLTDCIAGWLLTHGPLVAQAADGDGGGGGGGLFSMLPALIGIVVIFYFLMIRPERRKQKQHQAMLTEMKKNDRVETIGGIRGTVTNVQRDLDEITIKVDESTNTRLRMRVGAIARVITEESETGKAAEKK